MNVSVAYDFYVMKGSNTLREFKGFTSDFRVDRTKAEVLDEIGQEVLSWILSKYGRRSQLYQTASRSNGLALDIRYIEGL